MSSKIKNAKSSILLLLLLILTGIAISFSYSFLHQKKGATVVITINGKMYRSLPLNTPCTLDIPGTSGGFNRLVIKKGKASITDADCPDKLCVHQASISHNGESLVCLPHKVIVKVTANAAEKDLDGIAK